MDRFIRTEMLIGTEKLELLKQKKVAVFGIGGVGSYCAEALARAGVGSLLLVDNDTISPSNINRQIIALSSTVGRRKTEVMKERILDINPKCNIETSNLFYTKSTDIELDGFDYIVDAIDTVSSKLVLIETTKRLLIPIISSMGTGNKLDPSRFKICDIYKTSVCPLARVMRYELRKRNISSLKVVFSDELPHTPLQSEILQGKRVPASISFVPPAAGLLLASEVIRDLIKI